jgi:MoxR-like ATPase
MLETYERVVSHIVVPDEVESFIVRLVTSTQPGTSEVEAARKYLRYGASPRCALGLLRAARARAAMAGRPNVSFDDAEALFGDVANHRLILNYDAEADCVDVQGVIAAVLAAVRREYRGAA